MPRPGSPLEAATHRRVGNPSGRRKRSPKPVTRASKPGYIPRPLNCFLLFRLDYLSKRKGGPSRGAESLSEEVANAWRTLSNSDRLRWEKEAEKHREKHAVQNPGYTFKPTVRRCKRKNVKVKGTNEYPDVVNTPGSRDPAPPLSLIPDCSPDLMRCRELLRLPYWDDSVLTTTNQGLHLPLQPQGLACGASESLCRRSSSAPIPTAARMAHGADTWTDPTLANRDPSVLPTHLNHHPSYSGIRPGVIPADLFSPAQSQHSLHHERLAYPTQSSVKQEETRELFERYQKEIHSEDSSGSSQSCVKPETGRYESSSRVQHAPQEQQQFKGDVTILERGYVPPTDDEHLSIYPVKQEQELHEVPHADHMSLLSHPQFSSQDMHNNGDIPTHGEESKSFLSPYYEGGVDPSIPQGWFPEEFVFTNGTSAAFPSTGSLLSGQSWPQGYYT